MNKQPKLTSAVNRAINRPINSESSSYADMQAWREFSLISNTVQASVDLSIDFERSSIPR